MKAVHDRGILRHSRENWKIISQNNWPKILLVQESAWHFVSCAVLFTKSSGHPSMTYVLNFAEEPTTLSPLKVASTAKL